MTFVGAGGEGGRGATLYPHIYNKFLCDKKEERRENKQMRRLKRLRRLEAKGKTDTKRYGRLKDKVYNPFGK